jgi:glutamate dehydrogenase/leucine dehydrogenase
LNRVAATFNAQVVGLDEIYDVPCDVFSPNALGGSLNEQTIARLKCSVVCGGANNQLATPEDGKRLADRGIVYAPDFIVNSGGVINIAEEERGYNADRARARGETVFQTTLDILAMAKQQGITPGEAAKRYAKSRIKLLNDVHSSYLPGHAPIPR